MVVVDRTTLSPHFIAANPSTHLALTETQSNEAARRLTTKPRPGPAQHGVKVPSTLSVNRQGT